MRKLTFFLAAVSLVLVAEKALCYETTFSIEPESFNSLRYEEMRVEGPIELSIRTGRFLSVDPTWESADLGKPQSWNRYSYVLNNPVNLTDPDGKCGICWDLLDGDTPIFEKGYDPKVSDNPPRSQAEFDRRVAAGLAVQSVVTFQTYTKTNPDTGQVYSGKTSGTGTPEQNVARRDAGHHKNAEGYGPAQLDKSSTNEGAIRGREQQLIEANGGARSRGGTSGNAINGISDKNPKKGKYLKEAVEEFGQLLKKIFL